MLEAQRGRRPGVALGRCQAVRPRRRRRRRRLPGPAPAVAVPWPQEEQQAARCTLEGRSRSGSTILACRTREQPTGTTTCALLLPCVASIRRLGK